MNGQYDECFKPLTLPDLNWVVPLYSLKMFNSWRSGVTWICNLRYCVINNLNVYFLDISKRRHLGIYKAHIEFGFDLPARISMICSVIGFSTIWQFERPPTFQQYEGEYSLREVRSHGRSIQSCRNISKK